MILDNGFFFGKKFHRPPPAFPADAGFFYAAERCVKIAQVPAIDPDDAAFDFGSRAFGARVVLRPDGGSETVLGAVGDGDSFFFRLERQQRDHRPKNFFLIGAAVGWQSLNDGRLDKITILAAAINDTPVAASQYLTAFFDSKINIAQHFLHVRFRDHCTMLRLGFQWIADFYLGGFAAQCDFEPLINGFLYQQTRAAQAYLTLIGECRRQRAVCRRVNIRILKNNCRVFAAEFERYFFELLRSRVL